LIPGNYVHAFRREVQKIDIDTIQKEDNTMKYGAQNQIKAKVISVKKGDVMSLIKFTVTTPTDMASVITTESAEALGLKTGDEVQLIVKAIHVLPVKP
jgi:molybdopterin-binding protein